MKMEDNHKKKDNNKKTKKMEDDIKKRRPERYKICSQFLLNLGANLSSGWLSSLRFLNILWEKHLFIFN
jgi:hypothetical protein